MTKEIGTFNGAIGVIEYNGNFLTNPPTGRVKLEEQFETIWEYEKYLFPLVEQSQKRFHARN